MTSWWKTLKTSECTSQNSKKSLSDSQTQTLPD